MQIPTDVLKEIQKCKSADELIAKAAEANLELTPEYAESLLNSANADLGLEELDSVAGGSGCSDVNNVPCPKCGKVMETVYVTIGQSIMPSKRQCKDCRYQENLLGENSYRGAKAQI